MPVDIGIILLGEIWDECENPQVAEDAHQSVCFSGLVRHFAEPL